MGKQIVNLIAASTLASLSILADAAPVLNAISHKVQTGEDVEVRLDLSEPIANPTSFTIDNPARIAIDLPQTRLGAVEKVTRIDTGIVRDVRSVEAGGKTRVVVDLVRLSPYTLRAENNSLILTFSKAASVSTVATTQPGKPRKSEKTIKAVDFRRGVQGQGQLFINLSDPSTAIDIDESLGKITLNLVGTRVPESLERRLDVIDFATPITTIDALNSNTGARITLSTQGLYQYMAYQAGDTYTVEVRPVTKAEAEAKKERYTGEKLSLNFQNIEVRAVLQLLADFTGLNIVASDSVQGNITLRLKNVPWDQAMDIVLKTRGLGMRQNGDVIMVAPNAELAALEKQELESKRQIEDVAPLRTRFYAINYAKAADIAKLLKGDKNSILTSRGSVTIDVRTNTLMVLETDEKLAELEALIKQLDIPIRQVLIESRIVIASNDYSKDLGSRVGFTEISNNPPRQGGQGGLVTSGSLNNTNELVENIIFNPANSNTIPNPAITTLDGTDLADRLNTNFAATGNAAKIAFGILGADYLVDLELSALQREGKGEVLSNPRVITSNQKEAKIEQGVEIPYQQASSSGATNISFKKAVLSLSVTPQITPDDRVIMDLKVTKDSVGQIVNGTPSINKREIETQVLVNNGDTVVLGGIYEQSRADGVEKVPFLGDIPVLGYLFSHHSNTDSQSELLIFVSPKILKEGLQATLN
jgi:type IV pilus assembly protein PilQ